MSKLNNADFAEKNEEFKKCCELAGVKPTRRQASRFRLQKGSAFKAKGQMIRDELIKSGRIRPIE